MLYRIIILLAVLAALPLVPGCKAGGGGDAAPVNAINQGYNEGAKMPQVQPSWK